ncbi:MAG: hypothetical protein RE471_07595 [Ferroplasma sp.]|uniref:hypothetical protein n=1 Tax=Ferroplasma sp. TaxID=2591003 RepID=UPI002814FE68|nr:hypothetical protein [Ferroplasma sp.]WMT50833.1 MAG: hypothetical protein RE471_07595 [Ferroplasma sp.]
MMQATLEEFRPRGKIFQEFDYLIREYIRSTGTDNFDKYDLYDFTWKCPGRMRIKSMQRNGFFAVYRLYLVDKARRHEYRSEE